MDWVHIFDCTQSFYSRSIELLHIFRLLLFIAATKLKYASFDDGALSILEMMPALRNGGGSEVSAGGLADELRVVVVVDEVVGNVWGTLRERGSS